MNKADRTHNNNVNKKPLGLKFKTPREIQINYEPK